MLDKRRFIIISIFIISIIFVIAVVYYLVKNKQEKNEIIEYTPQEEISEEQMRQTIVSLYFKNDNGLIPEARLIDVKELLENPYEKILDLLIKGPKNVNLKSTIPNNTKINKIERIDDILIIDFSTEFILEHEGGEENEKLTIQSIVKTVTELTEINGVKIKINGEENKEFKDGKIKFDLIFYREN